MGQVVVDTQQLDIASATSMAANFNSASHEVKFFDMGSMQATWTGADATNAQIIPQASIDGVNFCDLVSGSNIKTVNAASGCLMYEFTTIGYSWLRAKFVANANTTGSVTITTFMKRRRHV